jgi:hypothetical protein
MNQPSLDFSTPSLTPQSQRLLDRLKMGPITNCDMRDQLSLLSYTKRLSEVRRAVHPKEIVKRHLGNGVYEYRLQEVK